MVEGVTKKTPQMKNKKGQTEQEIQAEILRTYAAWKAAKGTPLEPQLRKEFYAVDTVVS